MRDLERTRSSLSKRETFAPFPSYSVGIFLSFRLSLSLSLSVIVAVLPQAAAQSDIQIHSLKLKLAVPAAPFSDEASQPVN